MAFSVFLLFLPGGVTAYPTEPTCEDTERYCEGEDFSSYTTSSYINVGNPYLSPNGFYFEHVNGPPSSQFQIAQLANIGNAIYMPGLVSVMELPFPSNDVRFVITGGGAFNIAAYDVNGAFVRAENVEVYGTAQAIHFGGVEIFHIVVAHIQAIDVCDEDYGEPYITAIQACESNWEHVCP